MNNESLPVKLILASGSKYRSLLLQRLGLPFECHPPKIDESGLEDESSVAELSLKTKSLNLFTEFVTSSALKSTISTAYVMEEHRVHSVHSTSRYRF